MGSIIQVESCHDLHVQDSGGGVQFCEFVGTVEPLSNDHPHQRPSLLYDHILCDGHCFLFV